MLQRAYESPTGEPSADEPHILYGDSTPFPFGLDFLIALRAVVDCCVAMLGAQHAIDQAVKRSSQVEEGLKGERWRLDSLLEAVRQAAAPFANASANVTSSATDIMAATRAIVERERVEVERRWSGELQQAERIVEDACGGAYQALEALLLRHTPPETGVAWRIVADADGHDVQARLMTRFGLEAHFGIAVPEGHAWSRLHRAADLASGLALRVPKTIRLDRLFVSEAVVEPDRISLWLRRAPRTGAGVRISVTFESAEAEVQLLDDLGQPSGDIYELDGDDRAEPFRLASALLDSTFDLALRRQLMTGAALDGTTLRGRFEPRDVCTRLIAAYAPIVSEIAHRSCAPDELLLRRDLGGGRREAVFITRGELRARLTRLPPTLRALFDPFEL
ncbi:MAG: uncharacterized protein JWM53_6893 [bacterium]|nr:uncharacterized protein [bacterium]